MCEERRLNINCNISCNSIISLQSSKRVSFKNILLAWQSFHYARTSLNSSILGHFVREGSSSTTLFSKTYISSKAIYPFKDISLTSQKLYINAYTILYTMHITYKQFLRMHMNTCMHIHASSPEQKKGACILA